MEYVYTRARKFKLMLPYKPMNDLLFTWCCTKQQKAAARRSCHSQTNAGFVSIIIKNNIFLSKLNTYLNNHTSKTERIRGKKQEDESANGRKQE